MSITREQVADLREGDVVELRFPSGSIVRGVLTSKEHYGPGLGIASAGWTVRDRDGEPGWGFSREDATLSVVSRAPRPLYVNHPRTEPAPGDVVRDADGGVWLRDSWKTWHSPDSTCTDEHADTGMEQPLRLLVDGKTGQVVP